MNGGKVVMKYKDFLELMRKKLLDAKGKDDKT